MRVWVNHVCVCMCLDDLRPRDRDVLLSPGATIYRSFFPSSSRLVSGDGGGSSSDGRGSSLRPVVFCYFQVSGGFTGQQKWERK